MSYRIKDMAKYNSDILNKAANKKENKPARERTGRTLYLNSDVFVEFKKIIKPLSPSESIDQFMIETIEKEKKKKKD